MEHARVSDSISELITCFNDINGNLIDELHEEPSPLEFMRYVARNAPFVVRGGASSWEAVRVWNASYLERTLANHTVNVAVTPNGRADAPTNLDGDLVFAKPWEEDQPFPEFLSYVRAQEAGRLPPDSEVRYAQTQNDNLRHEYVSLFAHVQPDVPWARIALQQGPEAINLWIGNSRSVTALHRDNYENVYVQVLGRKHFVLLPPLCQPCVGERRLRPASYTRRSADWPGPGSSLKLEREHGGDVPFATWDPDDGSQASSTDYSVLAKPVKVTLEAGDMLYLPAMWYHKVSQSCSSESICVAVNYWYDMEFRGPLYPLNSFVTSVGREKQTAGPQ